MERKQLYWEDVTVGQEIPTSFTMKLDLMRVILQVSGTQDWYPVHHDRDFAKASGVPDVFMNTGFLTACMGKLLTDWMGPDGRLRKYRLEMRKMNLWDDQMSVKGNVTNKYVQDEDHCVDIEVWIETDTTGKTIPCTGTLVLPSKA